MIIIFIAIAFLLILPDLPELFSKKYRRRERLENLREGYRLHYKYAKDDYDRRYYAERIHEVDEAVKKLYAS